MQTGGGDEDEEVTALDVGAEDAEAPPLNWGKGWSLVASGYHFQMACWSARESPIAVISGGEPGGRCAGAGRRSVLRRR